MKVKKVFLLRCILETPICCSWRWISQAALASFCSSSVSANGVEAFDKCFDH